MDLSPTKPRALHEHVDDAARVRGAGLALRAVHADGTSQDWSFDAVRQASRRMAAHLLQLGVCRRDRVAIVLPQRAESAIMHVACSRIGALSMPLSPLFGADGLAARMADGKPRLVLCDAVRLATVQGAVDIVARDTTVRPAQNDAGPHAPTVLTIGAPQVVAWRDATPLGPREHEVARPDDAMFLVYTSGTTSKPKGVLLPHRVLAGRMTGFLAAHRPFDPAARRTLFYSPADWSWIGGLLDALFAPWAAGSAVLAHERSGHFDPASALAMLAHHDATHAFLPPTALKALARSGIEARHRLRGVHSAGEPLAPTVAAWARRHLADTVTNVYGLTEAAFLVGTAADAPPESVPEGAMGRPFEGHDVALLDEVVCVRRGSPTLMLGYWRGERERPDLPLDGHGWFHTGDVARVDGFGFLHYVGRRDDIIKTSGYRVGPAEVEASLLQHPAVAECAVVGVPDETRGTMVKAFVKLAPGAVASDALARELQDSVRTRLAAHAYPRAIEFVDDLPMTVTGKLRRRELRDRGP